MGFYIRKSISAGPFRFNLSGSGLGLSVGVKGFRLGTGPRGNYVHMGRGGLYYRASLNSSQSTRSSTPVESEQPPQQTPESIIETGNVIDMRPANRSQILEQINKKLALISFWPWPLVAGGLLSVFLFSQLTEASVGMFVLALAGAMSALLAYYDKQRKTVVVMYDLDEDAIAPFRRFVDEFDKLRSVSRIWNLDWDEQTADWKRNAGAGHLVKRKAANLTHSVPSVVRTNLSVPAVLGGRQNIYFFPDVVLIVQGSRAGALSYDQLDVSWTNTTVIEGETVAPDSQVVGHTWRFVNRNGGPDRRFNNNRQLPKVLYLQMMLTGLAGLRKVLQFSQVIDHTGFDAALHGLRELTGISNVPALEAPQYIDGKQNGEFDSQPKNQSVAKDADIFSITDLAKEIETQKPKAWEYKLTEELLRTNVSPIVDQWHQLAGGTCTKKYGVVARGDALDWCKTRLTEAQSIGVALAALVNEQLWAAWGPAGQPGDADKIEHVCEKLTACARQILEWEETVRHTALPAEFAEVRGVLSGILGPTLDEIKRVLDELASVLSHQNSTGHTINLVVKLPEHLPERLTAALGRATKKMAAEHV